jgi:hypothetical protein
VIPVKPTLAARAPISSRAAYDAMYLASITDPARFWGDAAAALT